MAGQYTCHLKVDVKSTQWRQRLCDLILIGVRKIDPDRTYSTIEIQSFPVIDREVKCECLKKGYEIAFRLFHDELRTQSIEGVAEKRHPKLWTSQAMKS